MKKLPNYRGRITLFIITYLFVSTMLLATVKAGDFNVPPQATVSGRVTDTDGLPLAGVHIHVEYTKKGVISDLDGAFSIEAGPNDQLVFSIMGFKTLNVPIAGKQNLDIQLEQDVTQLGEVVLNAGYYTVKERERTGSIVSISSKELETQPLTNPISALQGRMAGVQVTQTTGVPGGGFHIRIRGQNSIAAGNEPLYIIDGMPYASESLGHQNVSAGIIIRGISPLNNLNFNDIVSIEVLKDADATAIYGSRGANGVVLITTKSGKIGKTLINFQLRQGIGKVASKMKLLSTEQYLAMRSEAFEADGITEYPSNAYDINGIWSQNRYTDWQKKLIGGTVYTSDFQGSISGGTDRTQFFLSGNYYKTGSVFPDDGHFRKGGGHGSFGHTSADGKFKVNFSTDYTVNNNTISAMDQTMQALILPPNAPRMFDEDGDLNWENGTWNNPLGYTMSNYQAVQSTLLLNSIIEYQLWKDLDFRSRFGYSHNTIEETRTGPHTQYNPSYGLTSSFSDLTLNNGYRKTWIVEPQLSWQKNLNENSLTVMVGATFQKNHDNQLLLFGRDFSSNKLINNIAAANSVTVQNAHDIEYNYQAIFGRFNYAYDHRYLLNITGRRDGSSRFGPNRKFANFGAIGIAWLFDEEAFVKELMPVLSYGKFRVSYGTIGNDRIGDYQFFDTYRLDSNPYDGINGLEPTRLFNPDFGWEKFTKLTLGLDVGILDDRLLLNLEYYKNRSSNQLVGIPMPNTTGFSSLQGNLEAVVQNSGWELSIHSLNFPARTGDFSWTTDFNISINNNKLIEYPGLEASTYANTLAIGKPLTITKAYQYIGIDPQTGIYTFKDFNADELIASPEDRQFLVDLSPKFHGGLINQLSWKGWSMATTFTFTKQKKANVLNGSLYPGYMFNQSTYVLDHWPENTDDPLVQQYSTGANANIRKASSLYRLSDRAYSDASYLRLKNIEFGFQFPKNILTGVDTRLFIQGQNLWTWTSYMGLDPETPANTLPPLREILMGIQITF